MDFQPCGRQAEERRNCRKQSLVYESRCALCNPKKNSNHQEDNKEVVARKGIYIGETSRTLHQRANEHYRDAKDLSEKSHILKHWMSSHEEEKEAPNFIFRILGTFRDCLSRQVNEAIRIHYSKDLLLNSKNEYAANGLTRLTIDENKVERKKRERKEEEEEKETLRKIEGFKKSKGDQKKT